MARSNEVGMADTTPRLKYPLIGAGEISGYTTANEATQQNDALVQALVISRTLTAPPASPAEGDTYIVAASPTGAWAGQAQAMAQYLGGTWRFYAPQTGWNCFDQAGAQFIFFNGTAWTVMPGRTRSPLPRRSRRRRTRRCASSACSSISRGTGGRRG